MKLYIFRTSQSLTIHDAIESGSVRFIGEFEDQTESDIERIEQIKLAIRVTADCIASDDEIKFAEITE